MYIREATPNTFKNKLLLRVAKVPPVNYLLLVPLVKGQLSSYEGTLLIKGHLP